MVRCGRLIMALLGIWALLLWGACGSATAQPFGIGASQAKQRARQEVLSASNGRYVFGQISDSSKDQFMLDTLTGRLWRIAESGEAGLYLRAVKYRTSDGKFSLVPEEISGSETFH